MTQFAVACRTHDTAKENSFSKENKARLETRKKHNKNETVKCLKKTGIK